jgi:hypothetical protein
LAFHRSFVRNYYLPKDAWPERYGSINSSVRPGFFKQFPAPFERK